MPCDLRKVHFNHSTVDDLVCTFHNTFIMSAAAVSLYHTSDSSVDKRLTVQPVNPKPYLQELTGKVVNVRLKWGLQYRGYLISTDGFMNLQVREISNTAR